MTVKLRPYQQDMVNWLANHESHVRLYRNYKRNKHLIDRYPHMLSWFYEKGTFL